MAKPDMESWWASLPVAQKERIARKGMAKAGTPADESQVLYPACSRWWVGLDEDRKQWIYDHCTGRHGLTQAEWNDANPYGD